MPGLLAQHFASFLDLDHAHAQQAADFLNSPSLSPSDLHGGLHHHQQVAVSDLSNNNNNNSTHNHTFTNISNNANKHITNSKNNKSNTSPLRPTC
mmetsp:Transcript_67097/g.145923  ORF Transcript_67097/g.145923 Transcript_67097/m.145923 type:complete len:95 (-) Transcript_67097:2955-3239(-)